jgi:hypothetical protein
LFAQAFGRGARVLALEVGVEFAGDLEELAIAGLPDFEKRAGIEAAVDGSALVETLLEGLVHQIFFKAFAAGILEDSGEPEQFLMVEARERVVVVGHGAIEI